MSSAIGQYVDARAQGINASQSQELGSEPLIVDSDALYYEAVSGARKRKVYGLGSTTSTFYLGSSSFIAWTLTSDNCNELVQSLQRRLNEKEQREKEMEEEMQAMKVANDKLTTQVSEIHEFYEENDEPAIVFISFTVSFRVSIRIYTRSLAI
ncbi:hypothetical protein GH714_036699 [Hevea brasiliensis]|uniref:Uncharacterized protein n=1 Tax=Hevea brasiliensis TaxID=3981 RepID=A0A6A6M5U2_HEVBR|nr:hypothetical protein GH714_036699 [Hevea brasiliensis]